MMKLNRKLLGAVALFAMFGAIEANAQSNLNVTATVLEGCVIDSPAVINMPFGNLDPATVADTVVTADFDFHCTAGTTVDVELGTGANAPPATYMTNRVMAGAGTNTLLYRLETTGGLDWGTLADTASVAMIASGWSLTDTATIQGRITQANVQAAAADTTYVDTVLITLTL